MTAQQHAYIDPIAFGLAQKQLEQQAARNPVPLLAGQGLPSVEQKPLTLDITDRLRNALNTARGIDTGLQALHDRLFGPAPSLGSQAEKTVDPNHFVDEVRGLQSDLWDTLARIDVLTNDLSSKI